MLRDSLRETLGSALAGLVAGAVDWQATLVRLHELRAEALHGAAVDPGGVTSFVTAVNLLTDCVRKTVEPTRVAAAVSRMDAAGGWESAFAGEGRSGERLTLLPGEDGPAFTVLRWHTFLDVFAERLGVARTNRQAVEDLWSDVVAGLQLPVEDIDLADPSGRRSTWISDDRQNGERFRGGDPVRDVYDALGLDWSGRPADGYSPDGRRIVRAVLLSCALHERNHVAGSLHCTTTLDGWGELLYVPRRPTGRDWPEHGSATGGPASDLPHMPEAVHGPATVAGRLVWAYGLGAIEIGDRATECGAGAAQRALDRLIAEIGGGP